MQKKILSAVLVLFLVGFASIASADYFNLEIEDVDVNLGSTVADDHGVALNADSDGRIEGNVFITDDFDGRNSIIQGGANDGIMTGNGLSGYQELEFGLGNTGYFLNVGNVANQLNLDGATIGGNVSGVAAGNLVIPETLSSSPVVE